MSRAATVRCRALPRARAAAPWRPVHRVSARRAHNHTPSRQHSHPPLSLQAEGRARTHTRTTDPLWHSVALQPRRSFQPQHIPPALPAGTPTVPARCGWAPIAHGPWGSWATNPLNILKAQHWPATSGVQRATACCADAAQHACAMACGKSCALGTAALLVVGAHQRRAEVGEPRPRLPVCTWSSVGQFANELDQAMNRAMLTCAHA